MLDEKEYGRIKSKAESYCARAEQSPAALRRKIAEWSHGEASDRETSAIMASLVADNYLNEERYARAYLSDKRRLSHYGPFKIKMNLKMQGVSSDVIERSLAEVSDEEWMEGLEALLVSKKRSNPALSLAKLSERLIRAGLSYGFSREMVSRALRQVGINDADDEW